MPVAVTILFFFLAFSVITSVLLIARSHRRSR